jgi:hypothetical protein
MAGRIGQRRRVAPGAHLARHGGTARVYHVGRHPGQGLRQILGLRGVRGPRHSPDHPLGQHPGRQRGQAPAPTCEQGTWAFAGSDTKRGASKWRCPTGECAPASVWLAADRLHTLVPRTTDRWKALYRQRTCVEHGFGRLKNEWAMLPLRIRRIHKVRFHVDLTDPRPTGHGARQSQSSTPRGVAPRTPESGPPRLWRVPSRPARPRTPHGAESGLSSPPIAMLAPVNPSFAVRNADPY